MLKQITSATALESSNKPLNLPHCLDMEAASHHNASDTDHTQLFAQMIARTGKDIEVLIDSLPGEESTAELQAAGLQQLEQESEVAGEQLRQTVKQGEQLLASLQAALTNIHT